MTHIDDDLIGPICEISDLEFSDDRQLNSLISAARIIRDREGFLVVEGEDDINAILTPSQS